MRTPALWVKASGFVPSSIRWMGAPNLAEAVSDTTVKLTPGLYDEGLSRSGGTATAACLPWGPRGRPSSAVMSRWLLCR